MEEISVTSTKGILKAEAGMQKFSLQRYRPSDMLAPYIELYWAVRWDLQGQEPYRQTILSYPSVNLTFERETDGTFSGVYGVPGSTYTRVLQDAGLTFGIKFLPGGFYPFWQQPVSQLTGLAVPLHEIFELTDDPADAGIAERMLAQISNEERVALIEAFLLKRLPQRQDANLAWLHTVIQAVIDNREITQVEDLVARFGMSKRSLQRIFNRYVGVSPKWIIQRYRLQEAADQLEQGLVTDWTALAHDLGYYDQSHFIRDFKAVIGISPDAYHKTAP